jgi:hypothetical protein
MESSPGAWILRGLVPGCLQRLVDRQGAESKETAAAVPDALLVCSAVAGHRPAALQSAAISALPHADAPPPPLACDVIREVLNKQQREQRWPLGLFLVALWAAHPWASGPTS